DPPARPQDGRAQAGAAQDDVRPRPISPLPLGEGLGVRARPATPSKITCNDFAASLTPALSQGEREKEKRPNEKPRRRCGAVFDDASAVTVVQPAAPRNPV